METQKAVTSTELAIPNLVSKEGEWNNCSFRFSTSDDAFFFIYFFFVRRRAKETINGGTYGLRRRTFVIITIFLPHRRVKTFSDDYSVLLLTFLPSVSKIWCHQDWQAILKQKGCYVIFEKEANNFNFRRKYKLTSAIRDGAKHVEAVKPFDLPLSGSTISTILNPFLSERFPIDE